MSSRQEKYGLNSWTFTRPWMTGLLVFLLLTGFSFFVIKQRYDLQLNEEKQAAINMAESAKSRLQQSLQYSLSATQALTLIIAKDGIPQNFDSVASNILQSNKYIDALQLVPGGVIRYIYPLHGNEAAIGFDILKDSARSKEAYKAIAKKELFFAGPFELKQGGLAVVGRLPFFINTEFWGFSAVIIKLPTLLRAAGIDTTGSDGYYYQVSKINPDTNKEEFFLPERTNSTASAEVSVTIPNGEWKLSATPINGYKALKSIIPISLLGLMLSLVGAAFAAYLSRTPARLQEMVIKKTAALEKSEQRNKAIVNALPDMVFVMDRDGKFIDYNNPKELKSLVPKEQFMGKKITDIIPGELAVEMMTNLAKVFADRQVLTHSYQMEINKVINDYEARYIPQGPDDVMVLIRDVTENKKAELRIKESEEKYRTLVEQASDGIFIADLQGQILVVNPAGCTLSQFSKEELLQKKVQDLTDARELINMPLKMEEIATGKTTNSERKLKRKDGQLIDVEINAKLIAPDRFLAFVKDITERKKTEAEIKKSTDRFNFIALATNDIIWDWDLVSGRMWWNENFYNLFKLDKDKVKPGIESWYDGLHPDDLERAKKSLQYAIANRNKIWTEEYRFLKSDGEVVEIFDRGYIVCDVTGRPYRMIGSMLDITDRKKAELAIKESEYRLKTILDTDPECIKLMSRDVKLLDINSSGLSMIEAENIEQVKGQSLLHVVAEEYQKTASELVDRAFEGKTGLMEFQMITLKGNRRWCEVSIVPFKNAGGEIIAALGVTRDMTNWKKAEEDLKRSVDEIRRLTDHLQNIREEERMHVAREIHDELGQQLTVLKMDVSRLSKKLTPKEENYGADINGILDAINKMVETVRKISSELRPGLLDDLGLVATLDWYCHDFGKRTGIKTSFISGIKNDNFPQKINICLFRILQESLTNVARHADAKKADVSLMKENQQLVLLIEDNGNGFDAGLVADKRTLGIMGMKERAMMIGGTYKVYSTPGKGTIIEVVAPLNTPEWANGPGIL